MIFRNWLQWAFGTTNRRQRKARRQVARLHSRFRRLGVESLESREVLTINAVAALNVLTFTQTASNDASLALTINNSAGTDITYSINGGAAVNATGINQVVFNGTAGFSVANFSVTFAGATSDTFNVANNGTFVTNGANAVTWGTSTVALDLSGATAAGTFGTLTLAGGDGDDLFNVRGLSSNIAVLSTSGQAGNDVFNVSSDGAALAGNLDAFVAGTTLTVDAGAGTTNVLNVIDLSAAAANTATIARTSATSGAITGLAPGTINYQTSAGSFSVVTISGSDAAVDTFTITGTPDSNRVTVLQVNTQNVTTGTNVADIVNVQAISAQTIIDTGAGNDTINIGSNTTPTGHLDNINAALSINGGSGANVLFVNDSASAAAVANTSTLNNVQLQNIAGITNAVSIGYQAFTGATAGTWSNITVNGSNSTTFADVFTIASPLGPFILNALDGADTINVISTGAATTVNGGDGNDIINVGSNTGLTGNLDAVNATLTVDAGAGTNTLLVNDSGTTVAANSATVITGTAITLMAGGANTVAINYAATGGSFSALTVNGSNDVTKQDTITVTLNNLAGSGLIVNGLDGADTFFVTQVIANAVAAVNGGAGDDTFYVSSNAALATAFAGNVDNIAAGATLTIDSGAGSGNVLNIVDFSAAAANTATIAAASATAGSVVGLAPGTINFQTSAAGSYSQIRFDGSNGQVDTVTLTGTLSAANAAEYRINGNGAADVINLQSAALNLDGILTTVTVDGGTGNNTLLLDDTSTAVANSNAVIGPTSITGLAGGAATSTVNFANIFTLNVNGSNGAAVAETFAVNTPALTAGGTFTLNAQDGADIVNVLGNTSTTVVNGGAGNDTINVSSDAPTNLGNLDGIGATLTIDAGAGANILTVSDAGNLAANAAAQITNTQILGIAGAANTTLVNYSATGGSFSALNVVGSSGDDNITVNNPNGALVLNGFDGNDTLNVINLTAGTASVNGGLGDDVINVGSNTLLTGNLDAIGQTLTVAGGGGTDTLLLNDSAPTNVNTAVVVTNSAITGLAGLTNTVTVNLALNSFNAINVNGSNTAAQAETYTITSPSLSAGGTFTLNGQDGVDTINVAGTAGGAVTVNGGLGNDVVAVQSAAGATGTMDNITNNLLIDVGAGVNTLLLNDSASAAANTIAFVHDTGTATTNITGFAPTGTISLRATGGSYSSIQAFGSNNTVVPANAVDNVTLNGVLAPLTFDAQGGNDVFNVVANAVAVTLNGNVGSDTFNLGTGGALLDDITATLTLQAGSGGAGDIDTLNINDSSNTSVADVNYVLTRTSFASAASTVRPFVGVAIDANIDAVVVTGTNTANLFTVTPSNTATFTLHGLLPTFGDPTSDSLAFVNLAAAGVTSRTFAPGAPGSGTWTFNAPVKQVSFTGIEVQSGLSGYVTAAGADASASGLPAVTVTDATTGQVRFTIMAYETTFRGGVRVATADMNGDGVPDIITAPGRGRTADVKVFNGLTGALLATKTGIYPTTYKSGAYVAAGDLNGDGVTEVVVSTTRGTTATGLSDIRVLSGLALTQVSQFQAYVGKTQQGVSVAVIPANAALGLQAGIVTVPSGGAVAEVRIYDMFGGQINAAVMTGFEKTFRGGASLAVGDVDGDGLADIVLGAGAGGNSRVQIFRQLGGNTLFQSLTPFTTFTDQSKLAPLTVALKDVGGTGRFSLFVGQGAAGRNFQIMQYNFASYVGGVPSSGFNMSLVNRIRTSSAGVFIA